MHMKRDRLVNQAIQRIGEAAAEAGEITFDQLNALLPPAQFTAEQIEQLLGWLSEEGIQLIEG
jgi:RNA polymerase primary sigma factor